MDAERRRFAGRLAVGAVVLVALALGTSITIDHIEGFEPGVADASDCFLHIEGLPLVSVDRLPDEWRGQSRIDGEVKVTTRGPDRFGHPGGGEPTRGEFRSGDHAVRLVSAAMVTCG